MNVRTDTDRILDAFLAPEADRLADRVIDAALTDIARTPQRRALRVPWRFPTMPALSRATGVAAVALVAVIGAGAIYLNTRAPAGSGGPTPVSSEAPTAGPSATAVPTPILTFDPSAWTPYTSTEYGFTLAYPPNWRIDHAATRPFDPAGDDATSPESAGMDTFIDADGDVAFSIWKVPAELAVEDAEESLALYESLAEELCLAMNDLPCTGIPERSIPMCRERADCHPALIVPFDDDVFAYFWGNEVAVIWHAEGAPEVAKYGGATNLLQQFIRSRNVWPPGSNTP